MSGFKQGNDIIQCPLVKCHSGLLFWVLRSRRRSRGIRKEVIAVVQAGNAGGLPSHHGRERERISSMWINFGAELTVLADRLDVRMK